MLNRNSDIDLLYGRLEEIAGREKLAIANSDIDEIEKSVIIKEGIIKEIVDRLASEVLKDASMADEVIELIIKLNEESMRAIEEMQRGILTEMTGLQRGRQGCSAYIVQENAAF